MSLWRNLKLPLEPAVPAASPPQCSLLVGSLRLVTFPLRWLLSAGLFLFVLQCPEPPLVPHCPQSVPTVRADRATQTEEDTTAQRDRGRQPEIHARTMAMHLLPLPLLSPPLFPSPRLVPRGNGVPSRNSCCSSLAVGSQSAAGPSSPRPRRVVCPLSPSTALPSSLPPMLLLCGSWPVGRTEHETSPRTSTQRKTRQTEHSIMPHMLIWRATSENAC